jgi:putative transcriptional regulator
MSRPKKNDTELNELESDLLEAADAMLAHSRGELDLPEYHYTVPDEVDVKEIRTSMHLTQEQFAQYIGASVHAVRHWENGRRKPDGTARTLLCVLQSNPRAVLDALGRPVA